LVGQIFAAATYPTEFVEADRWAQEHSNLNGQQMANEAFVQTSMVVADSMEAVVESQPVRGSPKWRSSGHHADSGRRE
jgi:hypothetical protein